MTYKFNVDFTLEVDAQILADMLYMFANHDDPYDWWSTQDYALDVEDTPGMWVRIRLADTKPPLTVNPDTLVSGLRIMLENPYVFQPFSAPNARSLALLIITDKVDSSYLSVAEVGNIVQLGLFGRVQYG